MYTLKKEFDVNHPTMTSTECLSSDVSVGDFVVLSKDFIEHSMFKFTQYEVVSKTTVNVGVKVTDNYTGENCVKAVWTGYIKRIYVRKEIEIPEEEIEL